MLHIMQNVTIYFYFRFTPFVLERVCLPKNTDETHIYLTAWHFLNWLVPDVKTINWPCYFRFDDKFGTLKTRIVWTEHNRLTGNL